MPNRKTHSKLKLFRGILILVDVLITLGICFMAIYAQGFVTNGVFFLCCRKMLSISESIDDMKAYTQLTDHVYHQILHSDAAKLKEVISADRYYLKLLGCPVGSAIHSLKSWGLCCGIIAGFKTFSRQNWSNLILPCSKRTRFKDLML